MLTLASCEEKIVPPPVDPTNPSKFLAAEIQLAKDYPQYSIEDATWTEKGQYQIATFNATTKVAQPIPAITVWYEIDGGFAERKLDIFKSSGVPEIIAAAFQATEYANAEIWTVKEVELENRYSENVQGKVYTMELSNIENNNLEAELYFNAETGELIIAKEELDSEDNEDRYIVDAKLSEAVKVIYPDAIIIDASQDENQIEADIITIDNENKLEVEMTFTNELKYVNSQYDVQYGKMPSKFADVKTWFENIENNHPIPTDTEEIDITEGPEMTINEVECNSMIEVEYETIVNEEETELEVSFYLDADNKIVNVVNEDIKIRDKKLEAAVTAIYPNGVIIEFSKGDKEITAEVTTTEEGNKLEIEMLFTLGYKHVKSTYNLDYSELPAKFEAIKTWLKTPQNRHSEPANEDEVDITIQNLTINDIPYCSFLELNYKGSQDGSEKLFEISFYLNKNNEIVEVKHNAEIWKYMDGTFVLNQGNMTSEFGSLIFIGNNGDIVENVYVKENPGKTFPALASDMIIDKGKMYIIGQLGDLLILNANTLKHQEHYTASDLGSAGYNFPTHLAILKDDLFIRTTKSIYRFNLTNKTTTDLNAIQPSRNRMVVINNKVYAPEGPDIVVIDNNTVAISNNDRIRMPKNRQFLSLLPADDGNLWVSGYSYSEGSAIMKMNVQTKEIETQELPYSMNVGNREHPKIGAIGNKIYFSSAYDIRCHNFETNTTEKVFKDLNTLTDYKITVIYNGVGVDATRNKLYLNVLKGFGWDYLDNDILVFDIKSNKLEFNSKHSDYTRFPNGFHFTSDFNN